MQMGWGWMGVASMEATAADTDTGCLKALVVLEGVLPSGWKTPELRPGRERKAFSPKQSFHP